MPPEDHDQPVPVPSALSPEDRARVEHMLLCSRDAKRIVGCDGAPAIASDMIRTRALVNCFTEIGEAAARLSPMGKSCIGAVPWRQVVGMRNIIVHVYWGIDVAELVKTVLVDLPVLDRQLHAVLAIDSKSGSSSAPPAES